MKTMIIAVLAVMTLGMGAALAESDGGGVTAGALEWQAANGNPKIPATEWFAMSPTERDARVQQLQQQAATAVFPGTSQSNSAVAQGSTSPRG